MLTNTTYAHGAVEKYSNQADGLPAFVVNDQSDDTSALLQLFKEAVQKFAVQSDGMAQLLGLSLGIYTLATGTTYTVTPAESVILIDSADSGAKTITLPTAAEYSGRTIIIKDAQGTAATDNITITPDGSETIDSAADLTIDTDYGNTAITSNGVNWFKVIAASSGPTFSSVLLDLNTLSTVIDDDVANTTITATSEPAASAAQYTYVIDSADIPITPYVLDWCAFITIGGFNNHATLSRTLNWRIVKNGANAGAGSNSITAQSQRHWYIKGGFLTAAIVPGDTIGIKLWTDDSTSVDFRYVNIYIIPRYMLPPDSGSGNIWTANNALKLTGAVSGVTYIDGTQVAVNLHDADANQYLTFANTIGNITPFFGSSQRIVNLVTSGSAPADNNAIQSNGSGLAGQLASLITAFRYMRLLGAL